MSSISSGDTIINNITNGSDVIQIPTPLVNLGNNYELQHKSTDDITLFMNTRHDYVTFHNEIKTVTNLKGYKFANDKINVGVSLPNGDWSKFLDNTPMIFIDFYHTSKREVSKGDGKQQGYKHTPNYTEGVLEVLNRSSLGVNFGGGALFGINTPKLQTEFNFTKTSPYDDEIISIAPNKLYQNGDSLVLPLSLSIWLNGSGKLRFNKSFKHFQINHYKQPFVVYFACIDPDNPRNIIRGDYSKVMYIQPKIGTFADLDKYVYDWKVKFGF